jgi:hypothetical protein
MGFFVVLTSGWARSHISLASVAQRMLDARYVLVSLSLSYYFSLTANTATFIVATSNHAKK